MIRCLLFGHQDGAPFVAARTLAVRCATCGRVTPGVTTSPIPPTVKQLGDPYRLIRHRLRQDVAARRKRVAA